MTNALLNIAPGFSTSNTKLPGQIILRSGRPATHVIFPTEDLVLQLYEDLGDYELTKRALVEVISQIFDALMSPGHGGDFPDLNRIPDAGTLPRLAGAACLFRDRLVERLRRYGMWEPNSPTFDYYYCELLGRDVVLAYFPY